MNGPPLIPGGALDGPLFRDFLDQLSSVRELAPGERVGPYRIERELGRGGSAVVYLAERADGTFSQQVALKWLRGDRPALGGREGLQRERELLASLDHPHIARLLDGGQTEDGMLWFAMDLVAGLRIDEHCEDLPLGERLRLLRAVCQAVHYAHSRGVIHGDIKPANVLVDDRGEPRLLDFSIAQILGRAGAAVKALTPSHASPEQQRGEALTTASDVYQLGRLLSELVADAGPRGGRSKDLAAVIDRATATDPEDRYASAMALADDVGAVLARRPVAARRGGLIYRGLRLVQRNPVFSVLALSAVLVIIGGTGAFTWRLAAERDQVRIEAIRAERVRDFLVDLFEAADPLGDKGGTVSAREIVEAGIEKTRNELADEPEIQAQLLGILGEVFIGLDAREEAQALLAEALALQRNIYSQDHPDLARTLSFYAVSISRDDPESAERYAREALEMRRRFHGDEHAAVTESLYVLGAALIRQQRYPETEQVYREALALRDQLGLAGSRLTAQIWNILGFTLLRENRIGEAELAYRNALAIQRELPPPDHPHIAESLGQLAIILTREGRFAEAEPFFREVLAIFRRNFGDDHRHVANTLHNMGIVLRMTDKLDESQAAHHEALAIRQRLLGYHHEEVALSLYELARAAHAGGAREEAERFYGGALSMFRDTLPDDHPRIAMAAGFFGWYLLQQSRLEEAEPLLEDALAIGVAVHGEDDGSVAETRVALGLLRAAQDRRAEARSLIDSGLERLQDYELADPEIVAEASRTLATLSAD